MPKIPGDEVCRRVKSEPEPQFALCETGQHGGIALHGLQPVFLPGDLGAQPVAAMRLALLGCFRGLIGALQTGRMHRPIATVRRKEPHARSVD